MKKIVDIRVEYFDDVKGVTSSGIDSNGMHVI